MLRSATTEIAVMTDEVGHPGAVDHVFRRQAGDIRARSPDKAAFHDRCPQTFTRAGPGGEFTSRAAAENKDIEPFDFTHDM